MRRFFFERFELRSHFSYSEDCVNPEDPPLQCLCGKITVKWNRSMLNKHTLCQSGFRTTALRPSESARLQIYSTDVINTRKGEKTLIYVLKKITITLFCRILQNKGKNIIPCKSWGRGCWNVNNIISCNVLENQKCTFFISSKLNLIHKAVVAGLYFLGQP